METNDNVIYFGRDNPNEAGGEGERFLFALVRAKT